MTRRGINNFIRRETTWRSIRLGYGLVILCPCYGLGSHALRRLAQAGIESIGFPWADWTLGAIGLLGLIELGWDGLPSKLRHSPLPRVRESCAEVDLITTMAEPQVSPQSLSQGERSGRLQKSIVALGEPIHLCAALSVSPPDCDEGPVSPYDLQRLREHWESVEVQSYFARRELAKMGLERGGSYQQFLEARLSREVGSDHSSLAGPGGFACFSLRTSVRFPDVSYASIISEQTRLDALNLRLDAIAQTQARVAKVRVPPLPVVVADWLADYSDDRPTVF